MNETKQTPNELTETQLILLSGLRRLANSLRQQRENARSREERYHREARRLSGRLDYARRFAPDSALALAESYSKADRLAIKAQIAAAAALDRREAVMDLVHPLADQERSAFEFKMEQRRAAEAAAAAARTVTIRPKSSDDWSLRDCNIECCRKPVAFILTVPVRTRYLFGLCETHSAIHYESMPRPVVATNASGLAVAKMAPERIRPEVVSGNEECEAPTDAEGERMDADHRDGWHKGKAVYGCHGCMA